MKAKGVNEIGYYDKQRWIIRSDEVKKIYR